jgi:hypothetical protein
MSCAGAALGEGFGSSSANHVGTRIHDGWNALAYASDLPALVEVTSKPWVIQNRMLDASSLAHIQFTTAIRRSPLAPELYANGSSGLTRTHWLRLKHEGSLATPPARP